MNILAVSHLLQVELWRVLVYKLEEALCINLIGE